MSHINDSQSIQLTACNPNSSRRHSLNRFEPASPGKMPSRPSLKCASSGLAEVHDNDSVVSSASGATATANTEEGDRVKLTRRATWGDEIGGDGLAIVHHVHDTHYSRGFWVRYRGEVFCLSVSAVILLLGIAAIIAIHDARRR